MSETWPFTVLTPRRIKWQASTRVNLGGMTLSGLEQRDRVDGGPLWKASLLGIPIWTGRQIAAHRALELILVGDVDTIVVQSPPPACDALGAGFGEVLHSDGSPFSDGSAYESGSVEAIIQADADLGTDELEVEITGITRALLPGDEFTLVHPIALERKYGVKRILATAGDVYTLEISPPLRDDVTAGELADFDDPRCIMRLDDPESFALELDNGERGEVDAIFVEANW